MKNLYLSLILLASTAISAYGQDPDVPPAPSQAQLNQPNPALRMGLSFTPLLGFFTSQSDVDRVNSDGARFTIKYGLHVDARLSANPNYYFSTGIFLLNTGGTLNHPLIKEDGMVIRNADYKLNYVNIPIAFLLRTNEIGYIRYFGRVGFDTGFNIRSVADVRDVSTDLPNLGTTFAKDELDISDDINLIRIGLHIEAGLEYNVGGSTNMFLSLEWNNGLNNVFNSDYKYDDSSRLKAVTNYIALNAGVYF